MVRKEVGLRTRVEEADGRGVVEFCLQQDGADMAVPVADGAEVDGGGGEVDGGAQRKVELNGGLRLGGLCLASGGLCLAFIWRLVWWSGRGWFSGLPVGYRELVNVVLGSLGRAY